VRQQPPVREGMLEFRQRDVLSGLSFGGVVEKNTSVKDGCFAGGEVTVAEERGGRGGEEG